MTPLKHTSNEFYIYYALDILKIVNKPITWLTAKQNDCRITHRVVHQQDFTLLSTTHGPVYQCGSKIHSHSITGFGKDSFPLLCPKGTHVEH